MITDCLWDARDGLNAGVERGGFIFGSVSSDGAVEIVAASVSGEPRRGSVRLDWRDAAADQERLGMPLVGDWHGHVDPEEPRASAADLQAWTHSSSLRGQPHVGLIFTSPDMTWLDPGAAAWLADGRTVQPIPIEVKESDDG
jgi:hypothetical protein